MFSSVVVYGILISCKESFDCLDKEDGHSLAFKIDGTVLVIWLATVITEASLFKYIMYLKGAHGGIAHIACVTNTYYVLIRFFFTI